jgi:hypothetical protein
VNSLVAFALGAKDAQAVRKEFIGTTVKKTEVRREPIEAEELLELPTGFAYAKLAGGRAIRLRLPPPLRVDPRVAEAVAQASWRRYGTRRLSPAEEQERRPARVEEPESFLE